LKGNITMRLVTYTPATRCNTPSMLAANPFAMLEAEMNRLLGGKLGAGEQSAPEAWIPVEISEDATAYHVHAALPGVKKEDIGLEVLDGVLSLKASRSWKAGEATQTQVYSRSVSLSEDVEVERISANHDNGMLYITLPKREQPKPRTIQVS